MTKMLHRTLIAFALAAHAPTQLDGRDTGHATGAAKSSSPPPNIILIMADDIGVECFGCYGGTSYRTPNIDAMAKRGMRFTHCYSQPLCTPTRVKLMTGRSNARNYEAFSVLPPSETTFATMLRTAGYRTMVTGKWQLHAAAHYPEGIRGSGTLPGDAGFDRWCLWQVTKLGSRYWKPRINVDGRLTTGAKNEFGPDRYTEFLTDFVHAQRGSQESPFLAYYPMALPHNPFVPTPDSPNPDAKPGPRHFGGMVEYIDKLVGRIVAQVEADGMADRTLILFTADNGTNRAIRSKRRTVRGEEITVRGGKSKTLRTGTHVPLIALWPGTVASGSTCDDLIDFSDFLPTFADLAGVEARPAPLDGLSFAPQLRGRPGSPREAIYCYYHPRPKTRKKSQAVRFVHDRRFKLYDDGRLFDLDEDPQEARPIDPGDNEVIEAIRNRLAEALAGAPNR